jgi:hypothetical protein
MATKKEVKDDWSATKKEVKDDWSATKKEAKDDWSATKKEAKDDWSATKKEVKDDWSAAKQDAKDTWKELTSLAKSSSGSDETVPVDGIKKMMRASPGQGGHEGAAGLSSLLGGGDAGGLSSALPAAQAAPASAVVTRAGGFGGEGIAHAVNSNAGATFLQSPSEGQLMVMRTQASVPLSPSVMSSSVVDHQMNGLSAGDAFASALRDHGYVLYERPWDSEAGGEFLKKAVL